MKAIVNSLELVHEVSALLNSSLGPGHTASPLAQVPEKESERYKTLRVLHLQQLLGSPWLLPEELSDDRLTVVYEIPLGSTTTALSATEVPHKIGSLDEEIKKIIDRPRTPYRKSIVWIFGVLLGKEIVCWQCSPSGGTLVLLR